MKRIMIALPLAALLVACGSKTGGGGSSSDIHIVGSSTVYPFTKAVAEDFMRANPGLNVTVDLANVPRWQHPIAKRLIGRHLDGQFRGLRRRLGA